MCSLGESSTHWLKFIDVVYSFSLQRPLTPRLNINIRNSLTLSIMFTSSWDSLPPFHVESVVTLLLLSDGKSCIRRGKVMFFRDYLITICQFANSVWHRILEIETRWYFRFKDGIELQQTDRIDIHQGEKGQAFLLIHDTVEQDKGLYICEAQSMAGRCRSSATLQILGMLQLGCLDFSIEGFRPKSEPK